MGESLTNRADRWITCPCGKRAYASRKEAKAVIRIAHSNAKAVSAYACPESDSQQSWHIGHLPQGVRRGEVGRSSFYESKPRPDGEAGA